MRSYRASKLCLGLVAGLALGMAMGTSAADGVPTPAAKVDSGLGELPPYSKWTDLPYATPAPKVDSGLGELPPYSQWQEPWVDKRQAKADRGSDERAPAGHASAHAAPRPR